MTTRERDPNPFNGLEKGASRRPRAAFAMAPALLPLVFDTEERHRLAELIDIDFTEPLSFMTKPEQRDPSIELLITGWGAPTLNAAALGRLPHLRAVVHWAGAVDFLDSSAARRGIAVSSGRMVNAIPVAEYTVAMIILSAKKAFACAHQYRTEQRLIDREREFGDAGAYRITVGIVAASAVGTLVMDMLRAYDVNVLVYDPWADQALAASHGAELVQDLEELARRCSILSVHAPALPATTGLISDRVLAALPDGAVLINTSRGVVVDQEALIRELVDGRLDAVLDVTEPDVLPAGHILYSLPNVMLTPHIAGSMGNELKRLGAEALREVERFVSGVPFRHPLPQP